MNDLLKHSQLFFKRNASTILTGIGGVGVIATSVLAVKATPKALKLIEQKEEEKGEKLTKMEVVKVAGPAYIPSVLMGTATIACIFGANILNKRQQAALASAYALLDNSYKEYRKKVEELYGEGADENVRKELAKDKYNNEGTEDDKQLFYDEYSQRWFESTTEDVLRAENELVRMVNDYGGAFLNEWYELIGLEPVDYGDYMGWSSCELYETYWSSWIYFEHTKGVMDDGLEYTIVSLQTDPSFDFENY